MFVVTWGKSQRRFIITCERTSHYTEGEREREHWLFSLWIQNQESQVQMGHVVLQADLSLPRGLVPVCLGAGGTQQALSPAAPPPPLHPAQPPEPQHDAWQGDRKSQRWRSDAHVSCVKLNHRLLQWCLKVTERWRSRRTTAPSNTPDICCRLVQPHCGVWSRLNSRMRVCWTHRYYSHHPLPAPSSLLLSSLSLASCHFLIWWFSLSSSSLSSPPPPHCPPTLIWTSTVRQTCERRYFSIWFCCCCCLLELS